VCSRAFVRAMPPPNGAQAQLLFALTVFEDGPFGL
jgi:hypothetical protein